ncbi:1037_t:CDS:1, partial [Gigaspora rosea]
MSNNIPTFSKLLTELFPENAAPVFLQNYTPLNLALTHNIMEQSLDTEISNIPTFSEPLTESLLENAIPGFLQSSNLALIHDITEQPSNIEMSNNMLSESLIESLPEN